MKLPDNIDERICDCLLNFWEVRKTSVDVLKGNTLDGFIALVSEIALINGLNPDCIYSKRRAVLPGYYRKSKQWDIIAVHEGHLIAAIEFKSQVGSLGNNINNRAEEAIGSATDLRTAFQYNVFKQSNPPWLGFLVVLEDSSELHEINDRNKPKDFEYMEIFHQASFGKRWEILCDRLIKEQKYNAACIILTDRESSAKKMYVTPNKELDVIKFFLSFAASIELYIKSQE
jgi:hypothetical protein